MLTKNVADGIHRIQDAYVNWYLVEEAGKLTIVDAGLPTSWGLLQQALNELGRRIEDVHALVLTHGHFDHIGMAERVRTELGVPVFVHENDVPLTQHPRQYGRARPLTRYLVTQVQAFGVIASFLVRRAWWPKPIGEVHRFQDGELPVPGSPRVVFTPGHTLGHCALLFPGRDALIAGDAVVTLDPYRHSSGAQIVSGAATADEQRALRSLDAIAETQVQTVLTGHGDPWVWGAERIAELARQRGPS